MTRRRDEELDEELQAHLRMAVAERMARGEAREAAEAAARRELGNLLHIREVTREQQRGRFGVWLERLAQDVRIGTRGLLRTPAFTLAAVTTVALAVGANSAVFTVVNGVLLRPLPFEDPAALYFVSHHAGGLPFEPPPGLADSDWVTWRERQRSFARATAYSRAAITLTGAGDATRLTGARVDPEFFSVLGIAPAIGRSFTAEETARDERVVVLSDGLWRARLGGDPRVVGTAVTLDGTPYTVAGVMPPGFGFPASAALWVPLRVRLDPGGNSWLFTVLGRLRPDVTPMQARLELRSVLAAEDSGGTNRPPPETAVIPMHDELTGEIVRPLVVFSGAVGFVLLIACVNVANLLLIRAAARRREMAVRIALGASRGRIARQLLTESLLVGVAGSTVGLVVAILGVEALMAVAPNGRIPRLDEIRLDGAVVAFTTVVALVTGLLFGILPALHGARRSPQEAMAHGTRVLGGRHARLRGGLVIAEVALALVLLVGAGLMIRSFLNVRSADKGYDGRGITTMTVDLPPTRYPGAPRQRAFHTRLLQFLSDVPGVRSASAVSFKPMSSVGMMGNFAVEAPSPFPKGYSVDKILVSPGYFETMGVRLLHGRQFSAADDANAPAVVVVSESVARRIWPARQAVGQRVSMQAEAAVPDQWHTVVGVVSDVVHEASMEKRSAMYFPYLQSDWSFILGHMTYVVRAHPGAVVAPEMRAALRAADPDVPAQRLASMDDALMEVMAERVFQMRLLAVFAAIALLLAAIGTYGVVACDVAERSREIALRMALGASPGEVIRLVMQRTGRLALAGVTLGVPACLALTGVLRSWLYGVTPTDPATMVLVITAILGVALAAGFVPARRASKVRVLEGLGGD